MVVLFKAVKMRYSALLLFVIPLVVSCAFTSNSRVFVSTPVSKFPKRLVQDCCTSPPPIVLDPATSVQDAMHQLLTQPPYHAAVVVSPRSGRVQGVVSLLDFLWEEAWEGSLLPMDASNHETYQAAAKKICAQTVQDVMNTKLPILEPTTTMRDAALLLDQHKTHLLPVVNSKDKLVGVLTSANVVQDLLHTYKSLPSSKSVSSGSSGPLP